MEKSSPPKSFQPPSAPPPPPRPYHHRPGWRYTAATTDHWQDPTFDDRARPSRPASAKATLSFTPLNPNAHVYINGGSRPSPASPRESSNLPVPVTMRYARQPPAVSL